VGEVSIDTRVLSFTLIVSLACAIVTSLFPAWKLSRARPVEALREHGQNATAGKHTFRFQNPAALVETLGAGPSPSEEPDGLPVCFRVVG
jgi:hypothetical protein